MKTTNSALLFLLATEMSMLMTSTAFVLPSSSRHQQSSLVSRNVLATKRISASSRLYMATVVDEAAEAASGVKTLNEESLTKLSR